MFAVNGKSSSEDDNVEEDDDKVDCHGKDFSRYEEKGGSRKSTMLPSLPRDEHIEANVLRHELLHGSLPQDFSKLPEREAAPLGEVTDMQLQTSLGRNFHSQHADWSQELELLSDAFVVLYDGINSSRRESTELLSPIVALLAVATEFEQVIDLLEVHNDGQLGNKPIDCVIMDHSPKITKITDYLETRARVARLKKLPVIPVAVISSPPMPDLGALPMGISAVLSRPLQWIDVVKSVGGLIKRQTETEFIYKDIVGEVERFRYPQYSLDGFEGGALNLDESEVGDAGKKSAVAEVVRAVRLEVDGVQYVINPRLRFGDEHQSPPRRRSISYERRPREDTSVTLPSSATFSLSDPSFRPQLVDPNYRKAFVSKCPPHHINHSGYSFGKFPKFGNQRNLTIRDFVEVPVTKGSACFLLHKAQRLLRMEKIEEARKIVGRYQRTGGCQVVVQATVAVIDALNGNIDRAIRSLSSCVEFVRYQFEEGCTDLAVPILLNLAALYSSIGDDRQALHCLNRAINRSPKCEVALNRRALLHRSSGRFAEACLDLHEGGYCQGKDESERFESPPLNKPAAAAPLGTVSDSECKDLGTYEDLFCRPSPLKEALLCIPLHRTPEQNLILFELLRDQTPLHALSQDVLKTLASCIEYRALDKAKYALRQFESADSMMLVISGAIHVKLKSIGARTQVIETLRPGEAFGDDVLISQQRGGGSIWGKHFFSYQTARPSEILLIKRQDFWACPELVTLARERLSRKVVAVQECGVFSHWDNFEDFIRLARMSHVRRYASNRILEAQNDTSPHFQVIISGNCHVFRSPDTLAQMTQKLKGLENDLARINSKYAFHHSSRAEYSQYKCEKSSTEKRKEELKLHIESFEYKLARMRAQLAKKNSKSTFQSCRSFATNATQNSGILDPGEDGSAEGVARVAELGPMGIFGESGVLSPGGGVAMGTVKSVTPVQTLTIHVAALQTFSVTSHLLDAIRHKVGYLYNDARMEALVESQDLWKRAKDILIEEVREESRRRKRGG